MYYQQNLFYAVIRIYEKILTYIVLDSERSDTQYDKLSK